MEKPYFVPPNHRRIVDSSPRCATITIDGRNTQRHRPDLPPPCPLLRQGMRALFSRGPAGSSPPEYEDVEEVEFFPVEQKIFEMPSV